jgi:DNA-binding protein H-NS
MLGVSGAGTFAWGHRTGSVSQRQILLVEWLFLQRMETQKTRFPNWRGYRQTHCRMGQRNTSLLRTGCLGMAEYSGTFPLGGLGFTAAGWPDGTTEESNSHEQAGDSPCYSPCEVDAQVQREIIMASLKGMNVEALLSLRTQIDRRLAELRAELEKQLEAFSPSKRKSKSSALRGRKVPPKYRSPSGETWAGRGARPKWMVAAMKKGKKPEDFLIKRRRG